MAKAKSKVECARTGCDNEFQSTGHKKFCSVKCRTDETNKRHNPKRGKKVDYEVQSLVSHDYMYDGVEFVFSVNDQLIKIDADRWVEIVADYSEDGGNLTQYEIAQKYGIPRPVLTVLLRKYGHFKARPPITREELKDAIEQENIEPLMERSIEVAEHGFSVKLQERRRTHIESENIRLRAQLEERGALKDEVRQTIFELADELPKAPQEVKKIGSLNNVIKAVHNPVFDPHLGLSSYTARGWAVQDYNSHIGCRMIAANGQELRHYISGFAGGRVETAYMTHGGDMFHAPTGKTEHGRPLQRDVPDRILMKMAVQAFKAQIDAIRPVVDRVVVKGVPGNHGHVFDEFLIDFLALHYADAADVEVDDSLASRAYFQLGQSLHVLDHGTTFSTAGGTNTMAFAERIARRISGGDYHLASRIYYYIGHLHHRESKSQAHLEIIRQPTIAGASDYEDMIGFWNYSMTDVYLLDQVGRIKDVHRQYMADLI